MLQEQLDALLADGEATSQQQQVREYGVLGSRAAAHTALPSPLPPEVRQLLNKRPHMGLDGSVHTLHYRGYHTNDNHLAEGGGSG